MVILVPMLNNYYYNILKYLQYSFSIFSIWVFTADNFLTEEIIPDWNLFLLLDYSIRDAHLIFFLIAFTWSSQKDPSRIP